MNALKGVIINNSSGIYLTESHTEHYNCPSTTNQQKIWEHPLFEFLLYFSSRESAFSLFPLFFVHSFFDYCLNISLGTDKYYNDLC